MAGKLINQIDTELDAVAADDLYPIWDTSASATKKVASSTLGLLSVASSNVTTGNVDATAGVLHVLDISGMTADRRFNLPSTAKVGDRVGVFIKVGDDAYELDLHTTAASNDTINGVDCDTTSWSRLFIAGECVIFRCVTADTDWIVEYDGRIPCAARFSLNSSSSTDWTQATLTSPNMDTTAYNVGSCGTASTSSFTARRDGRLFVSFNAEGTSSTTATWARGYVANPTGPSYRLSSPRIIPPSSSPPVVQVAGQTQISNAETLRCYAYYTGGPANQGFLGNTAPGAWTNVSFHEQLKV